MPARCSSSNLDVGFFSRPDANAESPAWEGVSSQGDVCMTQLPSGLEKATEREDKELLEGYIPSSPAASLLLPPKGPEAAVGPRVLGSPGCVRGPVFSGSSSNLLDQVKSSY